MKICSAGFIYFNKFSPWASVCTTAGWPRNALAACNLLRCLGGKYFDPLLVLDEGRYDQTGQTKYLTEVMEYSGDGIRDMGESLETLEERILGIARRFQGRRAPPEE